MDSDGPGSNRVNGNFVPWLSRKVFGWELTTRDCRQFVALAGVTGLDKGVAGSTKFGCIEVGGNGLVEALGTRMAQDSVVPADDESGESIWNANLPNFVALGQEAG